MFDNYQNITDIVLTPPHAPKVLVLAQRRCPNAACLQHLFVVMEQSGKVLQSYPAERLDFDTSNIPQNVAASIEQAIACHAEECYIAAGIMVRRALEELCQDKKATGATLKDRISSLKTSVVLPAELFTALDELRILGNDAAHVEAKAYDNIGKDEIEIALDLAKEILKAVYQLDSLVKRLQALKKP